jgi:hypothetical protein
MSGRGCFYDDQQRPPGIDKVGGQHPADVRADILRVVSGTGGMRNGVDILDASRVPVWWGYADLTPDGHYGRPGTR